MARQDIDGKWLVGQPLTHGIEILGEVFEDGKR
jgi:hypothetical protein